MKQKYIALYGIALLSSLYFSKTHVHRSISSSLPIAGPYIVWQAHTTKRGDLVEACLPASIATEAKERGYLATGTCSGNVIPVLKLVAATSGDIIGISARGISVNGRLLPNSVIASRDEKHRQLPHQPFRAFRLSSGLVWLYGTSRFSYDSRYFGAVPLSAIQVHAWAPFVSAPLPDLS